MATSVTLKPNAIDISGSTSGTTTLQASAVAGTTTLTLPAATDTLVGKATTDTLTNKTLTGAAMNGTLGATTPSTASVTTLTTSSTVTHSGGTANGVAYLDGSKVLTTGSALVFDSSNLGLGVTPSAWASGFKTIQLGAITAVTGAGTTANFSANQYWNGTNNIYLTSAAATLYQQSAGAHYWYTAASGTAGNAISFTQAMTLDASGNLGVGTTSPTSRLHVSNSTASTNAIAQFTNGTTGTGAGNGLYVGVDTSNEATIFNFYNSALKFGTNGSERARIDSSGNLLVGTTSNPTSSRLNVNGANGINIIGWGSGIGNGLTMNTTVSSSSTAVTFQYNGTEVGKIATTSTATSYVTSSDYRLKENIQPMTGALAKVSALKPCTYTWKSNGTDGEGFIAHELAQVCPHAVTGAKDAVDANGNPVYQGIDTSFLVATLTAAIQELKAEFDAYKASHP